MNQEIQQKSIYVNDIHMGVDIAGQLHGPAQSTLVLLHGFTGSAADWQACLAHLDLPGWRIIALDMLGHGRSDAPSEPRRYTIEHCQQDIIAVLRTLGIEQGEAVLLGYSMGGRIALYTALSGFFRALVLESASPGLLSAAERAERRASDNTLARRIEHEGLAAFVDYWEHLPLFASQSMLSSETRAALHERRMHNRPEGLANSLRGVGTGVQPYLSAKLSTLDIPALLIAGELDTKYCTLARQVADALPQAQLYIVSNAGHTVHLEYPAWFTDHVCTFCASLL